MTSAKKVAAAITAKGGRSPILRQGVVSTINNDATISVAIDGVVITGVKVLATAHAIVNEAIWLLVNGSDIIAIGSVASDQSHTLHEAWKPYTPALTMSGTQFSSVAETTDAAFRLVGKTCTFRISYTINTINTAGGTGACLMSLPVAARTGSEQIVNALAYDSSTGFYYRGVGRIGSGASTVTRTAFLDGVSGPNGWSLVNPFAPAAGDAFFFSGSYETA